MMMGTVKVGRATEAAVKREVSIRWLLEWAFQREKAQLEFGGEMRAAGYGYISSTAAIIQHEQLGCRVDGGGSSPCHPDADVVAAALAALPEGHGGRHMAICIAELARVGAEPDWMPNARPRFVPVDTHTNRHGVHAKTEDTARLGTGGWPAQPRRNRKGVIVHDVVKYCPVICRPSPSEIAGARRAYLRWWGALLELRHHFQSHDWLTAFRLSNQMPPKTPWK